MTLVPMEPAGRLVAMGWSARELLYCVYSGGAVEVFDVLGDRVEGRCFDLLASSLSGDEVVDVAFPWAGDSLAAQLLSPEGDYSIVRVDGLENPKPELVVQPDAARHTCMAVIDGSCTAHGRMELLLGTTDGGIVVVDGDGVAADAGLGGTLPSQLMSMTVSPAGKYVAAFGEDGSLVVLDSLLERKLLEFDTKAGMKPDTIAWAGEDAVVLAWPDRGVLLVGPFGDWIKLDYEAEGGVRIVQEADCVRLISPGAHELLQQVPAPLFSIRRIGSTDPGALLADAATAFADGDARCDETIRTLIAEDSLADAVSECMAAAGHEWDTGAQRSLLRAAGYGKSFEPSFARDAFVETAQRLRVLNACRDSDVALPLTAPQYAALTPDVLVDRLASRHMFRLALDLSDYLLLPEARDRVLVAWAVAKVQGAAGGGDGKMAAGQAPAGHSDESLRDLLRARLGTPGSGASDVSYADIAAAADGVGRRRLAMMLLDFEPRAADQVPILLRMGEGRIALSKALDSGDPDLAYTALLHLRASCRAEKSARKGPEKAEKEEKGEDAVLGPLDPSDEDAEFLRLILSWPAAVDLLASWASISDRPLLLKLYLAAGRFIDAGRVATEAAYRVGAGIKEGGGEEEEEEEEDGEDAGLGMFRTGTALKAHVAGLKRAAEMYRDGERHPRLAASDRAECAFLARATEEQAALLVVQAAIESELEGAGEGGDDVALVGTPLNTTLLNLWLRGEAGGCGKKADKLVKDFKVADAPATLVKVRALAKARDWPGLWAFADSKRSPVGYRPFAEACALEGAAVEARKFALNKISDPGERIDTLVALGAITEAAEAALKAKDGDRLQAMAGKALTPMAIDAVERALAALGM
jgi:hypothetical protein